jgi:hypothetical protein
MTAGGAPFMEIDFELKPLARYCTKCPRCSMVRKKQSTKSLSVFRDGDSFIRVKCNHDSECDYGKMTRFKDPEPDLDLKETVVQEDLILTVIDSDAELPKTWQNGTVYWYKDVLGRAQYGVIRYPSKAFAPLVMLKSGEWRGGAGVKYPTGQSLFGAEGLQGKSKVIIVEGEKSAVAGQEKFKNTEYAVVTWRGGSNSVNNGAWNLLKGKREIVLWPDNDLPGIKAMQEIAKLLPASTVKLLDVSHLPAGSDVADDPSKEDVAKAFANASLLSNTERAPMTLDQIKAQNEFLNKYKLTGFPVLDVNLKLPPSGVFIVEGRTGHGKSAFAINLADNFIKAGNRVVIFSYEMPASRILGRLVRISNPDIPVAEALMDEHVPEYLIESIKTGQLEIYDQSAQFKANDLVQLLDSPEYNDALIVLDYIQIVPMSGARYEKHEAIKEQLMDPLRVAANNHGFLVAALSQLTPNYASPELDSPRECRDIHMSAEAVFRVWNRDSFATHPIYDAIDSNYALHVIKNRDGESNQVFNCSLTGGVLVTPKSLMTPKEVLQHLKNARNNRNKMPTATSTEAF